jgi:hypothetical protein
MSATESPTPGNKQQQLFQRLKNTPDFICKTIHLKDKKYIIVYVKNLSDEAMIHSLLVKPFYENGIQPNYLEYVASLPIRFMPKNDDEVPILISEGYAVMFIGNDVFVFDVIKRYTNQIREATVETVIQGPVNAFSEDMSTNINLLRHRYTQPSLQVDKTTVGTRSRTQVSIAYDKELADMNVVKQMKDQIAAVNIPIVQAAGQLSQLLGGNIRTLFPRLMVTERPDRSALNIAQGKVVVLLEGTPFAIAAPATFYDFFASMEDIYQLFAVSRFLIILRYASLLVSTTLPAFYVAISAYNPELLRVQLILSIAGSRTGVPYPAFLEVLFMLLAMELLVEASIRLPKMIGSTATTVGGLILGQAATEAGLVSNIMIIIVATVAISNFVIPINAMSFAIRVSKYILLLFSTLFGLVGILLGLVGLVGYLVSMDSFGQPYLKLFENDDRQAKATQHQSKPTI